ncbi:MAG: SDR family NAD(P)-dependent oxidoreductase [Pseudomonadota bacterium]
MNFEDRVIVLSGGISPLTQSYAHKIAALGATMVLTGADSREANRLNDELLTRGSHSIVIEGNATDIEFPTTLFQSVIDRCGRVDVVVNNFDNTVSGALSCLDAKLVDEQFSHSVMSTIRVNQAVIPHMLKAGYGRIVNVASGVGIFGAAKQSAFAATTAAIIGFTKSLGLELKDNNIGVNALAPYSAMNGKETALSLASEQATTSSALAFLSHSDCELTGQVISAGCGRVARIFSSTVSGYFDFDAEIEDINDNLDAILATKYAVIPLRAEDELLLVDV